VATALRTSVFTRHRSTPGAGGATIYCRAIVLSALLSAGFAANASAYEEDLHYYVTFAMAVADGWAWKDARTVASANYGVDMNKETVAKLEVSVSGPAPRHAGQGPQSYHYHCFSKALDPSAPWPRNGDVLDTLTDLKAIVQDSIALHRRDSTPARRTRALIAFGVYLHCLEDSWSHSRFGNNPTGHARDSAIDFADELLNKKPNPVKNPDHPAYFNGYYTPGALVESLTALSEFLPAFGGTGRLTDLDIAPLIDAVIHPHGLTLFTRDRQECNREMAGHWLYNVLARTNRTNVIPRANVITNYRPSSDCADIHSAVFAHAHIERSLNLPSPAYPRLRLDGRPVRVHGNGAYERVDAGPFDLSLNDVEIYPTATPGREARCLYHLSGHVSNRGPSVAPPSIVSAVLTMDNEPFGAVVQVPSLVAGSSHAFTGRLEGSCQPLNTSATTSQSPEAMTDGTNRVYLVADVQTNTLDRDIANDILYAVVPVLCDVDDDQLVTNADVIGIFGAREVPIELGDPRDADGDGRVTVGDARVCELRIPRVVGALRTTQER
jgi:hypothetical protein